MRTLLLCLLAVLLLSGCVTQKKCDRKFPAQTMVIRKDSIIRTTQTIYSDTTITVYIKGDTVTNTVEVVNGMTITPSILTTQFAYSKAWVELGRLRHYLRQNDTTYRLQLDNVIRTTWESAEKYYSRSEVQVKTERYIPKWVWWLLGFSILAAGYWVFKIVKIFKT